MLKHWVIDLIGHLSGLSDAQLSEIERSLPVTKALIDLLNRAQPIIEQAQSLYTETVLLETRPCSASSIIQEASENP